MTMEKVHERFLRYVRCDTQSREDAATVPSTPGQMTLAHMLAAELKAIGALEIAVSQYGYVTATIPASGGMQDAPVIGLIAHMDTSPDASCKDVRPRVIAQYDGKDVVLNAEENVVMCVSQFGDLSRCIGQSLIVTDGTTLLGADDKAGIAEIMTAAAHLIKENPPHGKIRIAFTPDEEVGRGADHFDVAAFGADYAYTVDGGAFGTIEYENFNAASAKVAVNGVGIHPGSAKNKMVNAVSVAMAFNALLPQNEQPQYTEGYEGFWHLSRVTGGVERAELSYIIRDHDMDLFERRKRAFEAAAAFLNRQYTPGTVSVNITDSYFNMKKIIDAHSHLIKKACASVIAAGGKPEIVPIRGGTDGARLSYMGLPCPNLGTGGHNFHGKYEFITVESMERVVEQLIHLAGLFTVPVTK